MPKMTIGFLWFGLLAANAAEVQRDCPGAETGATERQLPGGNIAKAPADGRRGLGCLWLPDGSNYVGEFENDKFNHAGRYEWYKDGRPSATYEGEWREGLMHGTGKLHDLSTHSTYQGRFIDNEFAYGTAHVFYPGGSEYSGEMRGSKRDGQGYLRTKDGDYYEGFWLEDVLDRGTAKEARPDGSHYEGQYAHGQPNGTGTLISTDQLHRYSGEIRDGVLDGLGDEFIYFDEKHLHYDHYSGEFRDGRYHGAGRLDHSHREETRKIQGRGPLGVVNTPGHANAFVGRFQRGELRNGEIYFDNGIRYKGELTELSPNGEGAIFYPDGTTKTYNFVKGLPENW